MDGSGAGKGRGNSRHQTKRAKELFRRSDRAAESFSTVLIDGHDQKQSALQRIASHFRQHVVSCHAISFESVDCAYIEICNDVIKMKAKSTHLTQWAKRIRATPSVCRVEAATSAADAESHSTAGRRNTECFVMASLWTLCEAANDFAS